MEVTAEIPGVNVNLIMRHTLYQAIIDFQVKSGRGTYEACFELLAQGLEKNGYKRIKIEILRGEPIPHYQGDLNPTYRSQEYREIWVNPEGQELVNLRRDERMRTDPPYIKPASPS